MPVPSSITDLSTTASSNSPAGSDAIGNTLDDYLRAIQAIMRSESLAKTWESRGDAPTRTGNTTFTLVGDQTAYYTVGRRIKCVDSSTLYGIITTSAYSSVTTVTVSLDSGNLSASLTEVQLGPEIKAIYDFLDSLFTLHDNSDATKKLQFQLSGITTGNTRTITVPDSDTAISAYRFLPYAADSGSADAYAVAPSPAISAYATGQVVVLKPANANTSAATLNVNAVGATNIKLLDGTDPAANAMVTTGVYLLIYDGTNFVLTNPSTASAAGAPGFGGRLTLTTATPVTTTDATGATTIYYTPYNHDQIPIYNGSSFVNTTFTELSNATAQSSTGKAGPAAVTTNSNYDLFVWSDSGTLRLTRGPLWTSDTGRGTGAGTTELQLVKGVYTNKVAITNGPGAGLGTYVGTVRSDGSSQINDSAAKRHVWNARNRVDRAMVNATETADTWNYTTATWRQANGSTSNQIDFVCGLAEDAITAMVSAAARNSGGGTYNTGIGVDSTSANSAMHSQTGGYSGGGGSVSQMSATYRGIPGLGRHYLAWLEYAQASGTTTWYGDNGETGGTQSGISGMVRA